MTPPNTAGAQALSDEQEVRAILEKTWQPKYSDFGAVVGYLVHPSHVDLLIAALAGREQAGAVAMIPMQADDGRKGWYVQTDDFYLDIEQDADGKWSAFFRHTYGGEAFVDQAALAAPSAAVASRDLDDADMDAVVTAIAALNNGEIGFHAFCDRIVALSAPAIAAREQEAGPIELRGIAETLENQDGCWRSCSGCHELNEGHNTGPYSAVLKCHLGGGCSECGGIGAVWDATDYADMAAHALASREEAPAASAQCPKCGAPCTTTVNTRGGDHGWGTTDAERTVYRYAPEQSTAPNAELLRGWKRYEKLRKLTPAAFNRLHIVNVTGGHSFDDLVDALPEPSTPVPEQSAKGSDHA